MSVTVRSSPAEPVIEPVAPVERPAARLEVPAYDFAAAVRLEREMGVSHGLAQILVRRGLGDPAQARRFLSAGERHPPASFGGLAVAAEAIRSHLARGSRIVVHGDYDVDGVCATAILLRALQNLGADVRHFIPSRTEDGYGLSTRTVERLAGQGTALLVTVDCGITAVDEVAAARRLGMDVVVTDHHSPRADGVLPQAPIVHPGLGDYPCPVLCGAGVAFKLAAALLGDEPTDELELVAIATVADLMPLHGENRRLVREGLAALAGTARPGLRSLMAVSRSDPSDLDAGTVGFRLAPRLNAAGRLRRADAALELLLTEDPRRADEIAAELDSLNHERRELELQILWEAEAQVQALGERSGYVLAGERWHPGVIGIVASRIVERYHRPAVLVALAADGPGQGSGRSVAGFDLLGALHAVAPELERYGGHRAAAGLTVRRDRLDALRAGFEAHADVHLGEQLRRPVERVDAVVSGLSLGLAFAEELRALEPCGMGNPGPKLLVPGARVEDVRSMGEGKHARFSVLSGGVRARAVAFGCDGRVDVAPGEAADISFRLERNVWNGAVEPRLVLRAVHRDRPRQVEVLGEPESFLAGLREELARGAGDQVPEARGGLRSGRAVLDRRGESPLSVLTDAVAAGGGVLALVADVPRRLPGLRERAGGFALASHHALASDPRLADRFAHLVALDPPCGEAAARRVADGSGHTHLAWGGAELGFTRSMHDLEYALRDALRDLYRGLAACRGAVGVEAERLLRGPGAHGRPPRVAARLLAVLGELGLVGFDPVGPELTLLGGARTGLEHSPAFRAFARRHEEGLRCLDRAGLPVLA